MGKIANQSRRALYRRAFGFLRPYLKHQFAILLLMVSTTLLSLPQPIAVKLLIDDVLGGSNVNLLYLILVALSATFGLNALLSWHLSYLSSHVHQRVLTDLRSKMYDHIHRLGPEYYNHTQTGDIMYRLLNDTAMISNLIATKVS